MDFIGCCLSYLFLFCHDNVWKSEKDYTVQASVCGVWCVVIAFAWVALSSSSLPVAPAACRVWTLRLFSCEIVMLAHPTALSPDRLLALAPCVSSIGFVCISFFSGLDSFFLVFLFCFLVGGGVASSAGTRFSSGVALFREGQHGAQSVKKWFSNF